MEKFRKDGNVFIEYIIVLPLMIISIWLIMQLIVYVYANNEVDHAADSGAVLVTQQLRGTEGKIDSMSNKTQILEDLYNRLDQSLSNNGFVLFSKNSNGGNENLNSFNTYIEKEQECKTALEDNSKKRVICVFTKSIDTSGRNQDQIIVRVKAPFQIIGNFIPSLQDRVLLYGNGVSTKDISGRFQYY